MWMKPGGRALRFTAAEEFEVRRVAFSWRARFPFGLRVTDGYQDGRGRLEVRLAGLRLQRQDSPEITEGEVIRYLAELPWVPHALAQNPELEWRELEERAVEVSARGLSVRLDFDEDGDVVRASSYQRRLEGNPTPWGGEYYPLRRRRRPSPPDRGRGLVGPARRPLRLLERPRPHGASLNGGYSSVTSTNA